MRQSIPPRFAGHAQSGAALFVGVVLLVIVSLMAIAASGTSVMQERMAGGTRNVSLSHSGLESALRNAELALWANPRRVAANDSAGMRLCNAESKCVTNPKDGLSTSVQTFRTQPNWTSTIAAIGRPLDTAMADMTTLSSVDARLAHQPRMLIEDLGIELPPGASTMCESGETGTGCFSKPGGLETHLYRITARSTGATEAVSRAAESTFSAATY